MRNDVLEQLSRDEVVRKSYTVTLPSLQLVKLASGEHCLSFSTTADDAQKPPSQLNLADVFAVSHGKTSDVLQFFATLKVSGRMGHHTELLRLGIFQFKIKGMSQSGQDTESFLAIYDELARFIDAQNTKRNVPKKLLLFINPHSGENMRACRIFARYVSPLLKLTSINFKIVVLTSPENPMRLDAEELGAKWQLPPGAVQLAFEYPYDYCFHNNVEEFDGVITISGDGTLSDAVLGVLKRQYGEILPHTELRRVEKPAFGIIPAGSTDAMALTVYGNNDPLTAVLNVISGQRVGIDVQALFDSPAGFNPSKPDFKFEPSDSRLQRFCFTAVGGGGFMPKVIEISKDIRSVFRAQRFSAAAVPIFLSNKPQELAVYYKASTVQPKNNRQFCCANCEHCAGFSNHEPCNMALTAESTPWTRANYSHYMGVNIGTNASLSRYQMVGLAPHSHLGDGTADVVLGKHAPTIFHYLALHRKVATVSHDMYDLAKDGMEFVRVWEYSIEPSETADSNAPVDLDTEPKLLCSADGELFRCRRLHGIIYCQLFRMFGSGRPISTSTK